MTDDNQRIWDGLLIGAWSLDGVIMHQLVNRFVHKTSPILIKLGDLKRINRWLDSLELKRYPSESHDLFIPVRAFVALHSNSLSAYLWHENSSHALGLKHINNFNWTNVRPKALKDRTVEKARVKRGVRSTRFIELRKLDHRHDWKTVK